MTINFLPTEFEHLPMIQEWIAKDDWHLGQPADFWLTGSFVAFNFTDADGIVFFARVDREQKYLRLHLQFGPIEQVSKRRVAAALTIALTKFIPVAKSHRYDIGDKQSHQYIGVVTESVAPDLIVFMTKLGFTRIDGTNDYRLDFTTASEATA